MCTFILMIVTNVCVVKYTFIQYFPELLMTGINFSIDVTFNIDLYLIMKGMVINMLIGKAQIVFKQKQLIQQCQSPSKKQINRQIEESQEFLNHCINFKQTSQEYLFGGLLSKLFKQLNSMEYVGYNGIRRVGKLPNFKTLLL